MFPSSFDESNCVLGKPPELTHDECDPLSVFRGENAKGVPVVVSCWKMTAEELAEIKRTGRVWLIVWGETMPPAALSGETPFG